MNDIKINEKDILILCAALIYFRDADEIFFKDALFDFGVTIKEFDKLMNKMNSKLNKVSKIENKEVVDKTIH